MTLAHRLFVIFGLRPISGHRLSWWWARDTFRCWLSDERKVSKVNTKMVDIYIKENPEMQLMWSAIKLVVQERKRQDRRWGANRNLADTTWLTILIEEAGESAEAILKRQPDQLLKEATHSAAVALAWLESILRAAQQRNEAEASGGSKAIYHECGNCGVARFEHDGIIEKCLNCGDDEIDVAQIGEVP